jgi:hypothetical protein
LEVIERVSFKPIAMVILKELWLSIYKYQGYYYDSE